MWRFLIVCLVCIPLPVAAQREVHVVSVAQGWIDKSDVWAVPTAKVRVDRPGVAVTLVLLARDGLVWDVTASADTGIEQIILGGSGRVNSELTLLGIPLQDPDLIDLPAAFAPRGQTFRRLIEVVTTRQNVPGLASFHGRFAASERGFSITTKDQQATYLRDHLTSIVSVPEPLTATDLQDTSQSMPERPEFRPDGIFWQGRLYEPTDSVPPVLLPTDAVHDVDRDRIYGMTLGREGYVYSIDLSDGQWSVLANLQRYDGAHMILDSKGQRIIATGAFGRPGELRIIGLDGTVAPLKRLVQDFPGLTDLFDYRRDQPPSLVPQSVTGDWVVLEARARGGKALRRYAVHLVRGEVHLLGFREG